MTQSDLLQQLSDHKYAIDQAAIVAITDPRGVITYVNDRFCEISQFDRSELIGKTHVVVNSGFHGANFFKDLWSTIKKGGVWRGEIRNRKKNGDYYWVETTIVPFHHPSGEISQFLSIRYDITALKEAQNVILQQQTRLAVASKFSGLGELAANLTHEINNPLAAILGRCEMLLGRLGQPGVDTEYIRRSVESIELTARRIEKIIKSMRSFSLSGEGDPFEILPIKGMVDETVDFVQQRFKDYGIDLFLEPIDPDLTIECRSTEIGQVLLNLLNNAFDAVKELNEKWVRIEVLPKDSTTIQIQVTDSGHGIPEEVANRIFDPFFSTKEKQYGTGLGLSISKGLIERNSGQLDIDSSCTNTRFLITLPTRQPKKK